MQVILHCVCCLRDEPKLKMSMAAVPLIFLFTHSLQESFALFFCNSRDLRCIYVEA